MTLSSSRSRSRGESSAKAARTAWCSSANTRPSATSPSAWMSAGSPLRRRYIRRCASATTWRRIPKHHPSGVTPGCREPIQALDQAGKGLRDSIPGILSGPDSSLCVRQHAGIHPIEKCLPGRSVPCLQARDVPVLDRSSLQLHPLNRPRVGHVTRNPRKLPERPSDDHLGVTDWSWRGIVRDPGHRPLAQPRRHRRGGLVPAFRPVRGREWRSVIRSEIAGDGDLTANDLCRPLWPPRTRGPADGGGRGSDCCEARR